MRTLRFATIDVLDSNGQSPAPAAFVRALEQLSSGRLVVTTQLHYADGAADAESRLITDLADGRLDGGWPATRAFAATGRLGLRAVETPFLITSYAAQKTLVTSALATDLLHTLDGTGVVPVALTVGALRRPWAVDRALVDSAAWQGARVRSYNSPMQSETITALGGTPVLASYGFPQLVRTGELTATETDVAQYAGNGYGQLLPEVATNVVLWPKMLTFVLSQRTWDSLTREQQGLVREAGQRAVAASVSASYPEDDLAAELCGFGLRFSTATPAQLAELARQTAPLVARLADDPVSGPLLSRLQDLVAEHPGIDVLTVPPDCRAAPPP